MEKECESCLELAVLNDDGVCALCAAGHDAFRKAAGKTLRNGGTREEAGKGGRSAMETAWNDPAKDMSPFSAALLNCFKPGNPIDQLGALTKLETRIESGEFTKPQASAVIIPLPNKAMSGFSVARAVRESDGDAA